MSSFSKIIVLAITLVLSSYSVNAQKFGRKSKTIFGVKGGLNIANQTFSTDYGPGDEKYGLMTGFHLGGTCEKFFGRIFSIETDLLFSTKGHTYISEDTYEYTGGKTFVDANNKRVVNYLEIPIQLKASQQLGDNSLAFLALGPYFSTALNGVWVTYEEVKHYNTNDELVGDELVDTKEDLKFGSKSGDSYRRTDWGIQVNIGAEFGPLQVSGGYQWGISNIDGARANGAKHTNRIIKMSLGYRFIR